MSNLLPRLHPCKPQSGDFGGGNASRVSGFHGDLVLQVLGGLHCLLSKDVGLGRQGGGHQSGHPGEGLGVYYKDYLRYT